MTGAATARLPSAIADLGGRATPAGPRLRIAGRHSFVAVAAPPDAQPSWRVERVLRPRSGRRSRRTHPFAVARGRRIDVDLPAAGGSTWYRITAEWPGGHDSVWVQVVPPADRSVLTWRSPDRPRLRVHVAAPAALTPCTGLVVVLHGIERNADEYCDAWVRWAVDHDRVVVVPQFDRAGWPGARSYALGGVLDRNGDPRPRHDWAFTAVTDLHRDLRTRLGLADGRFDLWGHSAGAQFVHRYLLFEPDAPVRTAIAANAGWYTLPDLHAPFPYGLAHRSLSFTRRDVVAWVRRRLVLMRGTLDVTRDPHLRTTPEAEAQGRHRYARAASMLAAAREAAPGSAWELYDVPGAGHDFAAMVPAAQRLLAGAG